MGIIFILSYFYTTISNFYVLFQSSFNTALFKPYMTCHIFFEKNLENKISENKVSENKVEDKVSRDVGIDMIDYEKDWVKKVDSKGRVWVIPSLFFPY